MLVSDTFLRGSLERSNLILDKIKAMSGSYLDIGSQLGYFVLKVSELDFIATGIECSEMPYRYSNSLKEIYNKNNVCFMRMCVDESNVKLIPSYDVVSILNVFHHLVYFLGFDNADYVMRELASKTNKTMFFETGEYEEKGEYWTDSLSFMGSDSKVWVPAYLLSLGFKEVAAIGEFDTHLNKHRRTLYMCTK